MTCSVFFNSPQEMWDEVTRVVPGPKLKYSGLNPRSKGHYYNLSLKCVDGIERRSPCWTCEVVLARDFIKEWNDIVDQGGPKLSTAARIPFASTKRLLYSEKEINQSWYGKVTIHPGLDEKVICDCPVQTLMTTGCCKKQEHRYEDLANTR